MAESPGRLLSSICLGGDPSNDSSPSANHSNNKLSSNATGSCVNVFIHLFDWNRRLSRKGLFFNTRRLLEGALDSEVQSGETGKRNRRRNKRKSSNKSNNTPPMAKLLLIADETTRNSSQIHQPTTKSGELRSLQELLHLDQEESAPKMLQEFLSTKTQQDSPNHEGLLSLLMQEVRESQANAPPHSYPEKAPNAPRTKSLPSKCQRKASAVTVKVASSGCGGFSKRTSGLFLEVASKILDPRSSQSRQVARALVSSGRVPSGNKSHEEKQVEQVEQEENVDQPDVFSVRRSISSRRSVMSAPCSPLPDSRNLGRVSSSSCTSIRSLMELFLDDLEEDMDTPTSSSFHHTTVSEPSSPPRELDTPDFTTTTTRTVTLEPPPPPSTVPLQRVVTVDELEDHDYISFRDFLTGGGRRLRESSKESCSLEQEVLQLPAPSAITGGSSSDDDDFKFMMVHNPLFDDCRSEKLETEDDEGLEEILKSILYQAKEERVDTSRLTWLPDSTSCSLSSARESYTYNKDSGSEADDSHQMDNDSVEVTSESNCGEDCSQPSPVSVLDSPFDSEIHRKTGKREPSSARKRLQFGDEQVATSAPSTSGESCMARFRELNVKTLEEAEEYIMMVLDESGVSYHADITLLVPEKERCKDGSHGGCTILSSSVFERLEDRMRVQELIEHLEACSTSSSAEERSNHHSLESLRAHYERYHECRSRRRMVFDFVNEVLSSIVSGGESSEGTRMRKRGVSSGRELVEEARRQVVQWKREAFESIDELVARELRSDFTYKVWRDLDAEVGAIGMHCEQDIFKSMVEELARDLLA